MCLVQGQCTTTDRNDYERNLAMTTANTNVIMVDKSKFTIQCHVLR